MQEVLTRVSDVPNDRASFEVKDGPVCLIGTGSATKESDRANRVLGLFLFEGRTRVVAATIAVQQEVVQSILGSVPVEKTRINALVRFVIMALMTSYMSGVKTHGVSRFERRWTGRDRWARTVRGRQ